MKKIFMYYEDGGWQLTMDIKVVADNKDEAVELIWKYIGNSSNWDINYFDKNEVIQKTKEYKLDKSEILSDESVSSDLKGHFD